jgi:hypothetical protein
MSVRVREGSFVVPRRHFTVVGKIMDVGKGRLAFRYLTGEERLSQSDRLDILFAGDRYRLRNVHLETTGDFVLPNVFCSGAATTRSLF